MNRRRKNNKKRLRTTASRTKIEAKVARFLDDLKIDYKQNARVGKYSVDFLIGNEYIVECYGDYWHCSPQKYTSDYYSRGLKCLASARWERDDLRKSELESMGFKFLALWESDINGNSNYCKSKIKKHLTGVDIGQQSDYISM